MCQKDEDRYFLQQAIDLAVKNVESQGGPFAAIVVKDGKIVATGANRVTANNDPTAHAEVTAIRNACKTIGTHDLSGCELYTSCYPCPMCLSAIIWANIKTVYYGNTKEDAADIGFRDDFIYDFLDKISKNKEDNKILDLNQLDRDKALEVFERYKQDPNKIEY